MTRRSDEKVTHAVDPEQFTGPHQFQMDHWIGCAPFERLLHIEIIEAADGSAVLTMPFLSNFSQGAGIMHGGALVSLADTAVVMAIKSLLPAETHFATVSMESRFLYPVRRGVVTARARAANQEARIFRGEATVFDENGKAVLEFASIFKVARKDKIQGVTYKA